MAKLSMKEIMPASQRESREVAERKAMAGVVEDGRTRRRSGKIKQMVFRLTPERRDHFVALADALSAQKGRPGSVSLVETLERAMDALQREIDERARQ